MAGTYVIVGASMAGATAAATLREHDADSTVILIGEEPESPYERPPLSKAFLRGDVAFEETLVRPSSFYAAHAIETHFGVRATRIDPAARVVELEHDRRIPFGALLVATGARNRRLPIPGDTLAGIVGLRTAQDAERIKAEMAAGRRAVVVGMGFIGSEVTASLRQKGLDVIAIEPSAAPLVRVFGAEVGRVLADLHHTHGVRTIFEDHVAAFEGRTHVNAVVTRKGLRIPCDFVVLATGVEPAVEVVEGSGVDVNNGILVDEYGETNVPGIFAAGDVANHYHPVFGRHIRVEHWHNALTQSAAAARNMLGMRQPFDDIPWFWSDQYDAHLQYAGVHTTWDELVVRGSLQSGAFLACYIKDGLIDAAVALNRPRELRRVMPLIKARRPVNLDDLRDERIDLRALRENRTVLQLEQPHAL
jgi:3-phenylpropionate/trans-cinnamate dioxygenase ferredoxin reductase subunit